MKLAELGLKTKPETKYFAGGYVSFQTSNGELSFEIYAVGKAFQGRIAEGEVVSKDHFDALMSIKKPADCMRLMQ